VTVPRLTIVVVTFNSASEIGACLNALPGSANTTAYDVVVVDNASSDGTAATVRAGHPGVRVIDAGANLGFARANNVGIRGTAGELVLLLNPDAVAAPGAIDRLVGVLDAEPRVAVAGPRIVDREGRAELSFGPMIGPLAELRQKVLVRGHARGWPMVSAHVERITREPSFPDWVSGACLLIRREALEQAGLLDERYFLYTEDVDLCAAVRARGGLVRFSPEAEVVHGRGASRASAPGPAEEAYRRSQVAFYRKHHPAWAPLLAAYLKLRGRLPDTSKQDR
jgi:N-acetylglucosaminyl-diphospho-decaprenol L-rhamnosyltransferase